MFFFFFFSSGNLTLSVVAGILNDMQLSLLFTSRETFNSPGSYSSLWDLLFSSGEFQTEIYFLIFLLTSLPMQCLLMRVNVLEMSLRKHGLIDLVSSQKLERLNHSLLDFNQSLKKHGGQVFKVFSFPSEEKSWQYTEVWKCGSLTTIKVTPRQSTACSAGLVPEHVQREVGQQQGCDRLLWGQHWQQLLPVEPAAVLMVTSDILFSLLFIQEGICSGIGKLLNLNLLVIIFLSWPALLIILLCESQLPASWLAEIC